MAYQAIKLIAEFDNSDIADDVKAQLEIDASGYTTYGDSSVYKVTNSSGNFELYCSPCMDSDADRASLKSSWDTKLAESAPTSSLISNSEQKHECSHDVGASCPPWIDF